MNKISSYADSEDKPKVLFKEKDSITIAWETHLFGGKTNVKYYMVQFRERKESEEEEEIWKSMMVTPTKDQSEFDATISNLKPNTTYEIRVQATLKEDSYESSTPIHVTTLGTGQERNFYPHSSR